MAAKAERQCWKLMVIMVAATFVFAGRLAFAETPVERVMIAFGLESRTDFAPDAGLDAALSTAIGRNPGLEAARQRWHAAGHLATASRALPDPIIGLATFIEPVETRVGPQERILSVRQTLPFFGTRELRGRAQDARTRSAGEGMAGALLSLLTEVREAWYELAWLQDASRLTTRHLQLAQSGQAVALSEYESGRGGYAAVLRSQMEAARLQLRIDELRDRQRTATERLAASLAVEAADISAESIVLPKVEELPSADVVAAVLRSPLAATSPALRALAGETSARVEEQRLAGRARLPNLTLGVDWIQTGPARMDGVADSGRDAFVARASINLPLWGGRIRASRQQAAASTRATEAAAVQIEADLRTRLSGLHGDYADAERRAEVHQHNLLPRARQLHESVSAAYEAGTAVFDDLIDARATLLDLEVAARRARTDRLIALARIEAVIGRPIDGPDYSHDKPTEMIQ